MPLISNITKFEGEEMRRSDMAYLCYMVGAAMLVVTTDAHNNRDIQTLEVLAHNLKAGMMVSSVWMKAGPDGKARLLEAARSGKPE